jgi:hypothetical protein
VTRQMPPCMIDPVSFDMDHPRGRPRLDETPAQRMQRLAAPLIHACRTQCPILAQCSADPDARSAYGVVAGEYRPWPSDSVLLQLNNVTAKGRVMAALIDQVKTLQPGDRLPGPVELAAVHGVARNTVNAALRALQTDGVVTRTPDTGRHWIVTPEPAEPSESAA